MLVLTRNTKEKLIIGADAEITIHVLAVRGSQVRLGIEAPRCIPVHRAEIFEKIHQEYKEAANDD